MLSKKKAASIFAMHYLCTSIKPFLVGAQVYSEHLETLGAEEIERSDFTDIIVSRLDKHLTIR